MESSAIFTPGPIVELMEIFFRYVPLAPAGLALTTESMRARTLAAMAFSSKLALPTPACTMPAFSTRNSTAPPLASLIACVTSIVTVPTLGLGIRPRGPKTLPSRPTIPIMSGVAMQRSKLISPLLTCSARSSAPTMSAPAFLASSALAPLAKTATRAVRPVPSGRHGVGRRRGSSPLRWFRRTSRWRGPSPASPPHPADKTSRGRVPGVPLRYVSRACSWLYLDAHGARRTRDQFGGAFDVIGVQILHLGFGDLAHLRHGHRAGDVAPGRL